MVQGTSNARALAVHVTEELLYFASDGAIYWEQMGNDEVEWNTHTEITVQTGDVQGSLVVR